VIDVGIVGSSLSLRSFGRVGSALSVLDFSSLGSTLSVRSNALCGGSAWIHGKLKFGSDTYFEPISPSPGPAGIQTYVQGTRVMSLSASGGTLHGTWTAETVVAVSDRRLKNNIRPLIQTMEQNQARLEGKKPPAEIVAAPEKNRTAVAKLRRAQADQSQPPASPLEREGAALNWVLRQLRPVSYNFKQGSDTKNVRFGFIADEMERVLPQVVREMPGQKDGTADGKSGDAKKGIVYTDLIAVLTAMMGEFSTQLKAVRTRVENAELELNRLDQEDPIGTLAAFTGATTR